MVCIMTKVRKKITAGLQKNGGGNRLISYTDADRLKLEDPHGEGLSVVFLTKRHWMTFSTRSSSLKAGSHERRKRKRKHKQIDV